MKLRLDLMQTNLLPSYQRFPKSFYYSFVLQMTFVHSTTGKTQVELRDFKKNMRTCESVKRNAKLFQGYFHENSDQTIIRR